MNPRILLASFIIPLGLIIAAVPQNKTKQYKLTASELLAEVQTRSQYIAPEAIADILNAKDPSVQLIDVRSQDEFDKYHLQGAINVPLSDLLNESYNDVLDQEAKTNVFYSNGTITANEAWMITRQLGYKNNMVMEGGLNYWFDHIMMPKEPASTSSNEEFAKYDFQKAASSALGGGNIEAAKPSENTATPALKPLIKTPKKKKAAGGC